MNKAVNYKGILLMPGSQAFELYHDKAPDARRKLEEHMREVDLKDKKLRGELSGQAKS